MYSDWFEELDDLLAGHRRWWQVQPFHHLDYPWGEPELAAKLDALDDNAVAALDADSSRLAAWLNPWIPSATRLLELSHLPRTIPRHLTPPQRMEEGIPGRKWQQILAFGGSLSEEDSHDPILEWCAGKGHLGRLLGATQTRSIDSLEWQASLCDQGRILADHFEVKQSFVLGDAFASESANLLNNHQSAVALHACGDLHTTLMQHWAHSDCCSLSLSPCCYHLIRGNRYQPLSSCAQRSVLRLSKADLQLPLQQTVTAGAHVARQGQQEVVWRLAFDALQREWRGVDEYLPVPNLRKQLLSESFTGFVAWALAQKQLPFAADKLLDLDEASWLDLGKARAQKVRRMELVTHLFRRPLEIWLALDRTLYLEEQGAAVTMAEFCEPALTPRNILIQAQRV